ncbi:superoxide dismutase [Mn] 3.4, mitochondrial-like [Setaria viridis]|uniref:superoxide dismutase [Mn] 3.4, mitochondrial-like n=1 Tax=Setaria viridis TaxID=4556 RepID=UPI0014936A5E|nr:superoxide dismutase [Mn] 3.4, mitochondrial-like [Setaria viridis]
MALRTLSSKKILSLALGGARPLSVAAASARGVTTVSHLDLSYDFGALEPAISGEIKRLHHQKHHAIYVANYKALDSLDATVAKVDTSTIVQLQGAIKFNGSGHVNHSIFWNDLKAMSEGGGEPPHGKPGWVINEDCGSFEAPVKMNGEGAALQGSGWYCLALDKEAKNLSAEIVANQVKYIIHVY